MDALENVMTYAREYHEAQTLMRCKACGQLYFSDWRERISFRDDDDAQQELLIPVADAAEGLALHETAHSQLLGLPMLILLFPPSNAIPYWINR